MPSIHILSDLHCEFNGYEPPESIRNVDIVVLAGDIHAKTKGISGARQFFPNSEIIYVSGNHEYYHSNYQEMQKEMRNIAEDNNVHFLENNEVIINGVRFLGCTLWTDYKWCKNYSQKEAMDEMKWRISDHKLISFNRNNITLEQDAINEISLRIFGHENKTKMFTANDAWGLHCDSVAWLTKKLFDESFNGKTVVITHHCPRSEVGLFGYGHTELSGAFFSDININLFNIADLWIYGHTHFNLDQYIGKTRIISNQRGYSFEELQGFDPELIINM